MWQCTFFKAVTGHFGQPDIVIEQCVGQCVAQSLKNVQVISWCLNSTLSKLAKQTVTKEPRLCHEAVFKRTKLTSTPGQIKVSVHHKKPKVRTPDRSIKNQAILRFCVKDCDILRLRTIAVS